jgi:mono/diheme cytochrome c family protein/YHS domain-containing protein
MFPDDAILQVLGRAHPMVLHLPIGLLTGLAALELWSAWTTKKDTAPSARGPAAVVLWLGVFATLAAAASGLVLAEEGTHAGTGVSIHRTLGLVFTAVLCVAACCHALGFRAAYLRLLVVGLLVMLPAGHFGAALTHGERFLYAPLLARQADAVAPFAADPFAGEQDAGPTFATHIAPVLDARCVSCHGADARKGGLRLDSVEAISSGGSSGPALVAGDPASSPLLSRMRLPIDHDERMPPASKTQPTPAEIDLIEDWITAGAPAQDEFEARGGPLPPPPPAGPDARTPLPRAPHAEPPDLERLVAAFVHVSRVEPGAPNLWVDLAPIAATIDDDRFIELVGPVTPSLGELHAARTDIGDPALAELARAEALTTLDLSWTGIGPEGLASLVTLPNLRVLRVVGTGIGDESVATLARMPALRAVYLWRTRMTADGIAALRSERPDLAIDRGADGAEAIETEGELAFTSDRALPGEPAATPRAISLAPVNNRCPVSGAPVDPSHAIVFEGRVVGFCCPNCLKSFVDDPSAFADAIEVD